MISQQEIFNVQTQAEFTELALRIFRFQVEKNPVYNRYVSLLNLDWKEIDSVEKIPFMPIRFFKNHKVVSGDGGIEKVFSSSGTTGSQVSQHFVTDLSFYRESLIHSFNHFYGNFSDYRIFALLPSYLEREGSSLIDMVEFWIEKSGNGGFYLYNHDDLHRELKTHDATGQKSILIGVSFALLDFVEKYSMELKNTIVMETGGMKGRKEEITREELHAELRTGFGVAQIHSEYGMTELLSQAYSQGNSRFSTPKWMKIFLRDTEDPLSVHTTGKTGGINVVDLANLNSCSFIATDDLGKLYPDGSFEILGRFDHSDVRGCNLMVTEI